MDLDCITILFKIVREKYKREKRRAKIWHVYERLLAVHNYEVTTTFMTAMMRATLPRISTKGRPGAKETSKLGHENTLKPFNPKTP